MRRVLGMPSLAARAESARQHLLDGRPVPRGLLPAAVTSSWERSRALGVRPTQAPLYGVLRRPAQAQPALARLLLRSVSQEVDHLWSAFGGPDWVIFCVDPHGTVLHARRADDCRNPLLHPIERGRDVHEGYVGTTAPACTLHDGRTSVVVGNQHYLTAFADIFCLAVPLVGVHGERLGALDITGTGQRDVRRLHQHFQLASLAVEQALFTGLPHCHLLRVHADPRWLQTPLAGVVALDEDGGLVAASRQAREALGLPPQGALPAMRLHEHLQCAGPAQRRRLLQATRRAHRVACPDGTHVWIQHARRPRAGAQASDTAAPATPAAMATTLEEQAWHGIQAALADHGGNVAAAARQLGISRTTLYARLARHGTTHSRPPT